MNVRFFAAMALFAGMSVVWAQDAPGVQGPPEGGWQGQRGGRGMGNGAGMGRGTVGTVTEATADHFIVKTELGEIYTIHFSVNTRMMKQPPGGGPRRGQNQGGGGGEQRTPPQPIKPTDIKVGDVIAAGGEVDASAKSVGAVFVMLIDPERAKEMRAMEANYGKTWLMGKVTAINEVKVSLQGGPDSAPHSFVADENTTFRKRRDPITLADVQVGDMVRVEGAVKDGTFVATTVAVMAPPPNGPRGASNGPGQPPPATPQ
ncbi:MAG TPA: DUF5666 domain-containing protein [Terracidiphilus sp.]|jgi:hypothetical protein|nr:DUF5666 domain-containing protein [Terracidiphilus sp.]